MQHADLPPRAPECDDVLRAAATVLAASWRASAAAEAGPAAERAEALARLKREAARYGASARAAAMPPERLVPALRECVRDGVKRASAGDADPREFAALWSSVLRAALAAYFGTDRADRADPSRAVDARPPA
jgi:hypothetical protein